MMVRVVMMIMMITWHYTLCDCAVVITMSTVMYIEMMRALDIYTHLVNKLTLRLIIIALLTQLMISHIISAIVMRHQALASDFSSSRLRNVVHEQLSVHKMTCRVHEREHAINVASPLRQHRVH